MADAATAHRARLRVLPASLDEANAFVARFHRHHCPVVGHKFSLAVADEAGTLHGVAIVGRPVARRLDDGWTIEVTRVATDGCPNACSALYGATRRAAFALGYRRLVTYTLGPSCPDCGRAVPLPVNGFSVCPHCDATVIPRGENGSSLRGAGWRVIGEAGGGSWSRAERPRVDLHPLQRKLRWEAEAP